MTTSKELTVTQSIKAEVFKKPSSVKELLAQVKSMADDFKGDLTTKESRKEWSDFSKKINRSKTAVDDAGKEYVAELKALPKLIDEQRKFFRDSMDVIKNENRQPLTDWEESEKERTDTLEGNILEIINGGAYTLEVWQELPVDAMRDRLKEIKTEESKGWQEYADRARDVIATSIEQIETAITKRTAWDKEQAELEELRQLKAENEKKAYEQKLKDEAVALAAKEAEIKAQAEKERVTNEMALAKAAQEKAEAELAASKQKAIDDAKRIEQERIEAEKQAQADREAAAKAENDRIEAEKNQKAYELAKREADKKHIATINGNAAVCLADIDGVDHDTGVKIIEAIAKGLIHNVKVSY